jgi:hypothetical protein
MYGEKKKALEAAHEQDIFNGKIHYLDIHLIGLLRDEQRQVVRKSIQIYRLWHVSHKMVSNEVERYYSARKGAIYMQSLRAEYGFYKCLASDAHKYKRSYKRRLEG